MNTVISNEKLRNQSLISHKTYVRIDGTTYVDMFYVSVMCIHNYSIIIYYRMNIVIFNEIQRGIQINVKK